MKRLAALDAETLFGRTIFVNPSLPDHFLVITTHQIIVGNLEFFRLWVVAEEERQIAKAWLRDLLTEAYARYGLVYGES